MTIADRAVQSMGTLTLMPGLMRSKLVLKSALTRLALSQPSTQSEVPGLISVMMEIESIYL